MLKETPIDRRKYLRVAEAAERLNMSRQAVVFAIHAGGLPAIRSGKLFYVPLDAVLSYRPLASHARKGGPKGVTRRVYEKKEKPTENLPTRRPRGRPKGSTKRRELESSG
jgi:excisionase family DNA binding protein